jgi:hypothetical protein
LLPQEQRSTVSQELRHGLLFCCFQGSLVHEQDLWKQTLHFFVVGDKSHESAAEPALAQRGCLLFRKHIRLALTPRDGDATSFSLVPEPHRGLVHVDVHDALP